MKGTPLTPNLCRLWSVPHLGSVYATGCRDERQGVPICFLLVIMEVMEAEAWTAWGNKRHNVWFHFVLALYSPDISLDPLFCLFYISLVWFKDLHILCLCHCLCHTHRKEGGMHFSWYIKVCFFLYGINVRMVTLFFKAVLLYDFCRCRM